MKARKSQKYRDCLPYLLVLHLHQGEQAELRQSPDDLGLPPAEAVNFLPVVQKK